MKIVIFSALKKKKSNIHYNMCMRILIIEDDLKMRAMLKDALEAFHTVDTAGSFCEGVEFVESYTYNAVLLDRNLSGEDERMRG